MQWHEAGTVQHLLRQLYAKQQEVIYAPDVASYAYYATCVASGSLSWGDHLRMVTFRQELGCAVATCYELCDSVVTASHFQETCQYSRLWSVVLYTQMASDLRRIVPAWSVSLPTCWGVLDISGHYHRVRPNLSGTARVLGDPVTHWPRTPGVGESDDTPRGHASANEKVLVAFWKAVLRMSCAAHPPQLRNEGDWVRPGYTLVAFDYLYPARDFPAAGHWRLQPPESSSVPPALQWHLWHYISGVSIYVPERRMAHHGTGEVLYWFHSGSRLTESAWWPRFVQQWPVLRYVVDLPGAEAARELAHCHRWFVLRYGAGPHRFLAGYTRGDSAPTPARVRQWWRTWRSYLHPSGHAMHSHYTDLRLRMSSG